MLVVNLVVLTNVTVAIKILRGHRVRGGVRDKRLGTTPRVIRTSTRYYKRRRVYRGRDLLTTIDGGVRCCSSRRLSHFHNHPSGNCGRRRIRRFQRVVCAYGRSRMTK